MPITMMCDKTAEGAKLDDFWTKNVQQYRPGPDGEVWVRTTHVGVVLSVGERNGYDDSDFFALVWDAEQCKPVEIEYASTRGWTYPNHAGPDATPEVLAAYEAYLKVQYQQRLANQQAAERARLGRGKTVKVVKGRKVPVGTTGVCFWVGSDKFARPYDRGNDALRCGFKDAAGVTHWVSGKNVVVLGEGPAVAISG